MDVLCWMGQEIWMLTAIIMCKLLFERVIKPELHTVQLLVAWMTFHLSGAKIIQKQITNNASVSCKEVGKKYMYWHLGRFRVSTVGINL